jgi:hypothetical protein
MKHDQRARSSKNSNENRLRNPHLILGSLAATFEKIPDTQSRACKASRVPSLTRSARPGGGLLCTMYVICMYVRETRAKQPFPWLAARIRCIWMPSERHQELWALHRCSAPPAECVIGREEGLHSKATAANIHQWLMAKTDFGQHRPVLVSW